MPTELQPTKRPRMHGYHETPFEIPAEHLPVAKAEKSPRPILISILACFYAFQAFILLCLAMVPWGDPDSGIATWLLARPTLVFSLIPKSYQPSPFLDASERAAYISGLPVFFLVLAILTLVMAWRLWALTYWLRWATMFYAGARVLKIVLALSTIGVTSTAVPISPAMKTYLVLTMGWNILVFGYLAFYPGVKEAFEKNG